VPDLVRYEPVVRERVRVETPLLPVNPGVPQEENFFELGTNVCATLFCPSGVMTTLLGAMTLPHEPCLGVVCLITGGACITCSITYKVERCYRKYCMRAEAQENTRQTANMV
jgi:hypothetical protein